jgi:hypothetical protein
MKLHINYADGGFYRSQKMNSESAISPGGMDKSIPCNRDTLDGDFISKNAHILTLKRGAGYWLWKPYIINKYLSEIAKDDYLVYTDSGVLFIDSVDSLIGFEKEALDRDGVLLTETTQWIPSGPPWKSPLEYEWTKRDAFILTDTDVPEITHSVQANGAFMVFQPRDKAFGFLQEWIRWGSDIRAITDMVNCLGKPNYDGFNEHRHDQSLLSIIGKKFGFKIVGDMTHWGEQRRDPKYKTILNHHRMKD